MTLQESANSQEVTGLVGESTTAILNIAAPESHQRHNRIQ